MMYQIDHHIADVVVHLQVDGCGRKDLGDDWPRSLLDEGHELLQVVVGWFVEVLWESAEDLFIHII
jgi:hypothetical protein